MEKKNIYTFILILVLVICIIVVSMNYLKKGNQKKTTETAAPEFLEAVQKASPEAITCIRVTFYTEGGADSREITDG